VEFGAISGGQSPDPVVFREIGREELEIMNIDKDLAILLQEGKEEWTKYQGNWELREFSKMGKFMKYVYADRNNPVKERGSGESKERGRILK
jgi:hypothetical protein